MPVDQYFLGLTIQDARIVLAGLGELPLKVTIGTYDRLRAQMAQQDAEADKPPGDAPAPE